MYSLEFLEPYAAILIFLVIAISISCAMLLLPFLISPSNPDKEKLSPYECGFNPTGNARSKFDIRFYLVGILFVIFDLEIAFLFPWALALGKIGFIGYLSMMIFLLILTIGFIYEWKKGALDWE